MIEFAELRTQARLSISEAARVLGYSERHISSFDRGEMTPRPGVIELLKAMRLEETALPPRHFTFIDLFAGIGGMRRGFEPIGGECVFTSEWDRYSQKTYRANFPNDSHAIAGDITKIEVCTDTVIG